MAEPFERHLAGKRAYSFCAYNSCLIRGITADDQGNVFFAYDYGIQKMDASSGAWSDFKLNLTEELKAVYSLSFYRQKLYLNALEIDSLTGDVVPLIPGKNGNQITHHIDKEKGQMWIADAGVIGKYKEILSPTCNTSRSRSIPWRKKSESG